MSWGKMLRCLPCCGKKESEKEVKTYAPAPAVPLVIQEKPTHRSHQRTASQVDIHEALRMKQ